MDVFQVEDRWLFSRSSVRIERCMEGWFTKIYVLYIYIFIADLNDSLQVKASIDYIIDYTGEKQKAGNPPDTGCGECRIQNKGASSNPISL